MMMMMLCIKLLNNHEVVLAVLHGLAQGDRSGIHLACLHVAGMMQRSQTALGFLLPPSPERAHTAWTGWNGRVVVLLPLAGEVGGLGRQDGRGVNVILLKDVYRCTDKSFLLSQVISTAQTRACCTNSLLFVSCCPLQFLLFVSCCPLQLRLFTQI